MKQFSEYIDENEKQDINEKVHKRETGYSGPRGRIGIGSTPLGSLRMRFGLREPHCFFSYKSLKTLQL